LFRQRIVSRDDAIAAAVLGLIQSGIRTLSSRSIVSPSVHSLTPKLQVKASGPFSVSNRSAAILARKLAAI
jgi:hypothetical protein